ncbi:hypothetical protein ACO22_06285 [Paracoccidioides brasiliensis]|uniref:Aromatic amino acid beta-eliminating lyase/threonine aldolase domain-containing protein n=1 Tax=Paracoccidioides brasiliensis TaxID=121759 RepID=A0A1D2J7W8_PARBR|nr:hypothetical protein ACO22_06285 [Paracoccidioides brasiliensis]
MASSKPCIAANNFRSDTFTTPTPAMLDALVNATFGDDATMGNQIGVRVHLDQPPHSHTRFCCDYRAHVYAEEGSGLAILSQAMVTPVNPANGICLTIADVKRWVVLDDDVHVAPQPSTYLE